MKDAAAVVSFVVLVTLPVFAFAADPAPTVWIESPADGYATKAEMVVFEVGFQSWIDPETGEEGNVKYVDLMMNGALLETKENPPDVKSGVMSFQVDLSGLDDQEIDFVAYAYQANRKPKHRGVSGPVNLVLDRTAPEVWFVSPEDLYVALNEPRVGASFFYGDALSGVEIGGVHLALDDRDVSRIIQYPAPGEGSYEPEMDGCHPLQSVKRGIGASASVPGETK